MAARRSAATGETSQSRWVRSGEIIMINRTLPFLLLVLAVFAQSGCKPAAQPADPDRARAMLRDALEAWHNGETLDSFRERSSITVAESKWREGYRLLEYELTGLGQLSGFDWQC